VDGAHIGARDDLKIGVLPAVDRSLDLLHHLADRYDIFSSKVTALLGKNLILDLDAGHAGVKETASAMATQPRPTPFKAKVHMPSLLEELLAHAGQPGRAASMFALFRAIHKGGSAAASMEP
jgi:hypothetical protein